MSEEGFEKREMGHERASNSWIALLQATGKHGNGDFDNLTCRKDLVDEKPDVVRRIRHRRERGQELLARIGGREHLLLALTQEHVGRHDPDRNGRERINPKDPGAVASVTDDANVNDDAALLGRICAYDGFHRNDPAVERGFESLAGDMRGRPDRIGIHDEIQVILDPEPIATIAARGAVGLAGPRGWELGRNGLEETGDENVVVHA